MKGDTPSAAILHELESFRQMGSALYIAAHPDDENTELLAYLARGRELRTAYLSLTRGDGGQNVLGPDLREKLGVARTQELLTARQIDGAQQFFSRAVDFGFSKSYTETLNIWNKQEVLSDIVRVIREFRPDVLLTRFSPSPGGTHGHHTASAVLAIEAFKLAGDKNAFPEQGLPPWQPKRIFWNISSFQRDKAVGIDSLKIDISGKDSVSGESFFDIAGKSRSMHKTQGFDSFHMPGSNGTPRLESFHLLAGDSASKDILDGVDTTWARVPGAANIGQAADEIITQFNSKDPAASVPAILRLRHSLATLPADALNDPVVKEKQAQLDRILQMCLGLTVETTTPQYDIVPGEKLVLEHTATLHAKLPGDTTVRWISVRYPQTKREIKKEILLTPNEPSSWNSEETLPTATPLTQPWWLRKEGTAGMFASEDPNLIGTAENAPSFPVEDVFEVGGQTLVVHDQPVQHIADASGHKISRRLDVIPPVSMHFTSDVALMTPGASKTVDVEIAAARLNSNGVLKLEAPSAWKISPPEQNFSLAHAGQHEQFRFTITAPKLATTAKITAVAEMNGQRYSTERAEINYAHLPPQLLQSPPTVRAMSVDLITRGHKVGYLPGAGDSLPEALKQMGFSLDVLDDSKITAQQLQPLDAVIIGVRAFNVRNLDKVMPILFDYVQNGGNVIVQYNTTRPEVKTSKIAPFELRLSGDRVTDEKAAVTFLAPENPIFNTPNKITSADFDGWVQERGLYFPNQWDDHFKPLISIADPGEAPARGSLLVAQYGKGYYIYTGLSFFRQLPAAVPGAYRLLANMIAIGK